MKISRSEQDKLAVILFKLLRGKDVPPAVVQASQVIRAYADGEGVDAAQLPLPIGENVAALPAPAKK